MAEIDTPDQTVLQSVPAAACYLSRIARIDAIEEVPESPRLWYFSTPRLWHFSSSARVAASVSMLAGTTALAAACDFSAAAGMDKLTRLSQAPLFSLPPSTLPPAPAWSRSRPSC